MLFTLREIIEITITIVVIGYIFSGFIQKPRHWLEELFREHKFFDLEDWKYAILIGAPAIIFHELGHKFAGFAFGIPSYYHMVWWGLAIGVILRAIGSGFIFFVPGYVGIQGNAPPQIMGVIAFAGPLVNLIMWLTAKWMLDSGRFRHWHRELWLTERINMWLFIFNMLPIPPLDGSKVLAGILATI